jgi:hypothetical protein
MVRKSGNRFSEKTIRKRKKAQRLDPTKLDQTLNAKPT